MKVKSAGNNSEQRSVVAVTVLNFFLSNMMISVVLYTMEDYYCCHCPLDFHAKRNNGYQGVGEKALSTGAKLSL